MTGHSYKIDDASLYVELRELLSSGDLIAFVGAGLSRQASTSNGSHPPLWKELLTKMVLWGFARHFIDAAHATEIRECIEHGYLIDAGEELRECLQELPRIQDCLKECIHLNEIKGGVAHQLLVKLSWRAFITINYDDLIESQYSIEKGLRLDKFVERTVAGVMAAYRGRKPFIFKMHGDLVDPESIILGSRAYDRVLYSNVGYRDCLEKMISISSVLFLGFGAADPNVEALLARVAGFDGRDERHWMLIPEGSMPTVRAKRFTKDKGIKIIEYPLDENHTSIVTFLQRLGEAPNVHPPDVDVQMVSIDRKEIIGVTQ